MAKTKKAIVGVVAGVVATLAMGTTVAQANLLLYAEPDYRVKIGDFWTAMKKPHNMSANADDTLSSYKNNTAYTVAFAHEKNLGGRCFSGGPKKAEASFWFFDDNKISSFQLGRGCP